jgi:hypothetical protein
MSILAVPVMLSYLLEFFNALSMHPRLSFLSETLILASVQLGPFFFVFFVVYMAFAEMGSLLFGASMEDFVGIEKASITQFNMLLGDFDWEAMSEVNFSFAIFYFWSFYLIMFYLLLNMLLAIVFDAYAAVKESGENASPITRDARTFFNMYRRRCAANHLPSPAPCTRCEPPRPAGGCVACGSTDGHTRAFLVLIPGCAAAAEAGVGGSRPLGRWRRARLTARPRVTAPWPRGSASLIGRSGQRPPRAPRSGLCTRGRWWTSTATSGSMRARSGR